MDMFKVIGVEGISPGRNLEFDPTLPLNRTDKQTDFPGGELETGKHSAQPDSFGFALTF